MISSEEYETKFKTKIVKWNNMHLEFHWRILTDHNLERDLQQSMVNRKKLRKNKHAFAALYYNDLFLQKNVPIYVVLGNTLHTMERSRYDHKFRQHVSEFERNLTQILPVTNFKKYLQ